MVMRVPFSLSQQQYDKVSEYVEAGLDLRQIAKLLDMPLNQELRAAVLQRRKELKKAAKEAEKILTGSIVQPEEEDEIFKLAGKRLSIDDIAKLTDKTDYCIAGFFRDARNELAHSDKRNLRDKYNSVTIAEIMRLGSDEIWGQHGNAAGVKAKATATVIKKRNTRKMGNDSRYNRQTNRYIMDEWRSFGVLEQVRVHPDSIGLRSADGNIAYVKKKYTPHHGDILMKARGLKNKFVAVRMVQNFDTTEPRVIDISASQGIMSMATAFPDDTRNQSFTGRYQWVSIGNFGWHEHDEETILVYSDTMGLYTYERMRHPPELVDRFVATLQQAEKKDAPLLVCIDQKNPTDDVGNDFIVDAHIETDGFEVYADDHNTLLETIARVRDEADSSLRELAMQKNQLHEQTLQIRQEAEAKISELDGQFKETEAAENRVKAIVQRDVADLEQQERFLRDAKEGLHDYKVQILAKERDKAGKAVAVKMEGLKIVEDTAETDAQFEKRMMALEKKGERGARQAAAYRKIREATELRKARRAKLQSDDVIEVPPADEFEVEIDPPEVDLTLFDEGSENVPEMLAAILKQNSKIISQNDALITTNAMTDLEVQELRDDMAEEAAELSEGAKKDEQEQAYILEHVKDILGNSFQIKVNAGHARNSLCLRAGLDLTQGKVNDRVEAQFLKHIGRNNFVVLLPKNNTKAIFAIVQDSDDKNDFALKTCKSTYGKKWTDIEPKVTGRGGKRLVGKGMTPQKLLGWHNEIVEQLGT